MLIDSSYFTEGPRHILNASAERTPNMNSDYVNEAIDGYIKHCQPTFLKGVVGVPLASAVTAYLKLLDKYPEEERDADLEAVVERLKEPFANYVFYHILSVGNTQATMTGLERLKCANQYIAPIRRQVSAWNDMVDMLTDFSEWSMSVECNVPGIITNADLLTKINIMNI